MRFTLHPVIRDGGRKLLVDSASVVIFLVIMSYLFSGVGIIYKSFYEIGSVPAEVFTSASQSFTVTISFVYMLFLTRKYRCEKKEDDGKKGS